MKQPWIEIAEKELGVKEKRGGENPRIVEYHKQTSLKASTDEVPWCSSFANWVMNKAGYVGTRSAMARSWASWGRKLDKFEPGCIVVFSRGTGGQGHVAFGISMENDKVKVIGGNQSDSVCYAHYPKSKVIAYVWPRESDKKPVEKKG